MLMCEFCLWPGVLCMVWCADRLHIHHCKLYWSMGEMVEKPRTGAPISCLHLWIVYFCLNGLTLVKTCVVSHRSPNVFSISPIQAKLKNACIMLNDVVAVTMMKLQGSWNQLPLWAEQLQQQCISACGNMHWPCCDCDTHCTESCAPTVLVAYTLLELYLLKCCLF